MSGFASIIDQDLPIRLLTTFLRKGTLPHALLFSGIEGVGKKTAALAFAMACNCLSQTPAPPAVATDPAQELRRQAFQAQEFQDYDNPCGHCKACRKIESGLHPDVIQLKPSGRLIRIGQIRELCRTLALKPYEARYRVVIIYDAQAMNPEAANAFLKMLEEPPDRTLLILTALQASDLLPTIFSRCRHIRFKPIAPAILAKRLIDKHGIDPEPAAVIAVMAKGSYARAKDIIQSNAKTGWINHRNWLIEEMESLSHQPAEQILALAHKLSQNKKNILESLEIITCWLRDLVIYRFYPQKIINKDLTAKIQYVSERNAIDQTLDGIDIIQRAQKSIQANANLRLTLEGMLLEMAGSAHVNMQPGKK